MIPYNPVTLTENICSIDEKGSWYVTNLIEKSNNKDNVYEYELDLFSINLNVIVWGRNLTQYELLTHFRQIQNIKDDYPILVSEEGWILDGWHRVTKYLLEGNRYIKCKRFKVNPKFDILEHE